MKRIQTVSLSVLAMAGALVCSVPSQAALPSYADAKAQAEREGKYMLVIWSGSDWSSTAREVARVAEKFSKAGGDDFIWCVHDERENATEQERNHPNRPPGNVFNIPAFEIVSSDGKPVYLKEGVKAGMLPDLIKEGKVAASRYDKVKELWKKADSASGPEAAQLFGEGLGLLPGNVVGERRDIRDKIKKADPNDVKGMDHFFFDYLSYIEGIQKKLQQDAEKNDGKKDYKSALEEVDKMYKKPGWTPLQKQQVMAAKFWLYRDAGEKAKALQVLRGISLIDPKSIMGIGAENYYRYLSEPVKLSKPLIREADVRPDMIPTHLDISKIVRGPGRYKVHFNMKSGSCRIRNPRFMKGNTVVCELPANEQDKDGREFTLNMTKPDATELVFDCQGQGWFDQIDCDIEVTKED